MHAEMNTMSNPVTLVLDVEAVAALRLALILAREQSEKHWTACDVRGFDSRREFHNRRLLAFAALDAQLTQADRDAGNLT